MEKKLIATHDSATGEKGAGIISWLVTPWSRTQSKTIKEQYNAGCRRFDIRVKLVKGKFVCAHGIWHTKRSALSIFEELNSFSEKVYVELTYEGNNKKKTEFLAFVDFIGRNYHNITFTAISIKYGEGSSLFKVKYDILTIGECDHGATQYFLPLDGRSWHIIFPCPWLWKQFYFKHVEFDSLEYKYVDFL